MTAAVGVFGGVLIRRAVATERNSTRLARPQMHPVAADLNAFFTFAALWLLDGPNPVKMRTASGVHASLIRSLFVYWCVVPRGQTHVDSGDGHAAFADSRGTTLD